jgi:hypothetical protein
MLCGESDVPENSNSGLVAPGVWRIEMLASTSGFPIAQEPDAFGYRFTAPGMNGKSISIRWAGPDLLAIRAPATASAEMRKDAESGAPFAVDEAGIITFTASGADADKALRRAAALIRALPDTPLATFHQKTRGMPATTEIERLARQRVGQDIFRASLDDYWGGRCAVTGITERALLRESHTKPWAVCDSDEERLDVYNGFLFAAHFDAAFDAALMTFDDDGNPLFSPKLTDRARAVLNAEPVRVRLAPEHLIYLTYHRGRFEAASGAPASAPGFA